MTSPQIDGGRSDHAGSRSNRPRRSPRATGDRGAALVEFAIIAPLLFALIIGMFTGGISLSRKNSMTNGVREGARLGATLENTAAWPTAVRDRVVNLSAKDLTNSQVCVKLVRKVAPLTSDTKATDTTIQSWFGGGASCPFPDTLSTKDIPVGDCVVKVWAQRTSDLEVVLWSKTLTLDAASIGRYEREC